MSMRTCRLAATAAIALILCVTLLSVPASVTRPAATPVVASFPSSATSSMDHHRREGRHQQRQQTVAADGARSDQVAPSSDGSALDGSVEAALRVATSGSRSRVVLLTFGNSGVLPTLHNFISHATSVGAPFLIGAVDAPAFDQLTRSYGARAAAYKTPLALEDGYRLDGSNAHSSSSWQRFAAMRTKEVARIVLLGYDVLHTDVDVAWLRNPVPYIACADGGGGGGGGGRSADAHDEPLPQSLGCEALRDADVAVSSDNMSPGDDARGGVGYAIGGTLNTGILLIRTTDAGKRFAQLWHETVVDRACPATTSATCPQLCKHGTCYGGACVGDCNQGRCCTSDQQVLNRMVRDETLPYPGLRIPRGSMRTVRASAKSNITLGALPLALFLHGHGYFVQRARLLKAKHGEVVPARPYAVHATYTLDDHDGLAKAQRFREGGLWRVDPPAFFTGRYLAYNASLPSPEHDAISKGSRPSTIAAHITALPHYMSELRDAFALALALNRTLILPRWTCYCDRLWSGSDDIFHFGCMYPGAQDARFVPFVCPMDHVLSPKRWNDAGVPHRDAAFLDHHAFQNAIVDVSVGESTAEHGLLRGISEVQAARQLWSLTDAPVLRLGSTHGLLCGLEGDTKHFNDLAAKLLTPPPWCSTCFQPCKQELKTWLDDDAIAQGADGSNRWCARFKPPAPLPKAAMGCH